MADKRVWERELGSKVEMQMEEMERIMEKLKGQPNPTLVRLMRFHLDKLEQDTLLMDTSKHLTEKLYSFEVDEEGDHVFHFKDTKPSKSVYGYQ